MESLQQSCISPQQLLEADLNCRHLLQSTYMQTNERNELAYHTEFGSAVSLTAAMMFPSRSLPHPAPPSAWPSTPRTSPATLIPTVHASIRSHDIMVCLCDILTDAHIMFTITCCCSSHDNHMSQCSYLIGQLGMGFLCVHQLFLQKFTIVQQLGEGRGEEGRR